MPTVAQNRFSAATRLDPVYRADIAYQQDVNLAASTTYAKGTVLGELTATPGTFKPYASGNSDGSQIPKCVLTYACTTDASGNISWIGEFAQTTKAVPAYFRGYFKTAELTGLDANAITILGNLVSGVLASGIVRLG